MPKKPSSASLRISSRGIGVRLVDRRRLRRDLGVDEAREQILDLPLLGGELEVHARRAYFGQPVDVARDLRAR